MHVCKIVSTRKVNSPKVYLCILFFVGGKNHSDVSLVIGEEHLAIELKIESFVRNGLNWFEMKKNDKFLLYLEI